MRAVSGTVRKHKVKKILKTFVNRLFLTIIDKKGENYE